MTDDDIIKAYRAGVAVRTLATEAKRSGRTIRRILDAAQVPRRGPSRCFTDERRREIGERYRPIYEAGASIQDVADAIGVSYGVAGQILREGGTKIRGGTTSPGWRQGQRDERLAFGAIAAQHREDGWPVNRIAREYGHTWMYVRKCLDDHKNAQAVTS